MLLLALLLGGCHRKVTTPARDWKTTTNCLFFLAYKALGRDIPDFPEPPLEPGKSGMPQIAEFLQKFPEKPKDVSQGETSDDGYRYLEASLDDQLRSIHFLAKRGGFENKLVYTCCVVFIPGQEDTLDTSVTALFGEPNSSEKLSLETDEGHQDSDVEVYIWQTPLGVLTERSTYSEEDDNTVGVLELWATPAFGQARPRL